MISIPLKTEKRLSEGLKKFQPILKNLKDKDVNESDTVVIITDLLSEVFGYDKYTEITSEYSIKKTFCDLAIKINSKVLLLIECKAIGLGLKDDFIRQTIDYGSNSGVDWCILTNGHIWKVFKIIFGKPIEKELIYEFDLFQLNPKKQADIELLYYVCKEALSKSALDDLVEQKQTLSRFFIGQLLLNDSVLDILRKQIKKMVPDSKINNEDISQVLVNEIIKREILEGEKVADAKKRIVKLNRNILKVKKDITGNNNKID